MQNYIILEEIGKGSFGKIYKAQRKVDKKFFAAKEINYTKMNEREKAQVVTEVNILRELKHENIVKYFERIVDKENCIIYIFMEFCEHGDLAKFIGNYRKMGKYIDENVIWKIFSQIVSALHTCHTFHKGVILHRDLKPSNILLDSKVNVKLCDFGLSRILEERKIFANTFVGTPFYMSPEQISENSYDVKSDMWSLGCLLYEMCNLTPPFEAANQSQLCEKIRLGKFHDIPSHFSPKLQKLIFLLLKRDSYQRPNTIELMQIPQISGANKDFCEIEIKLNNLKLKEKSLQEKEREIELKEENLSKREHEFHQKVKNYYFGIQQKNQNDENAINPNLTPKTPLEFIKMKIQKNQKEFKNRSPLSKLNKM